MTTNGQYAHNSGGYSDSLWTEGDAQWAVWVGDGLNYLIARRDHVTGLWSNKTSLTSTLGVPMTDGHGVICVAVDADGYLHVAANMHGSAMILRKSTAAGNPAAWSTPTMPGTENSQCTYPRFIKRTNGELLLLYRYGSSGSGDEVLWVWNRGTGQWEKRVTVFDGITNSVSWYRTVFYDEDRDVIHIAGTFRATTDETTAYDFMHIKSTDGGTTWKHSDGTTWAAPRRYAGGHVETWPATNTDPLLIPPQGLCVDADGHPHTGLSYPGAAGAGAGKAQIWHVWWDGVAWQKETITVNTTAPAGHNALHHQTPKLVLNAADEIIAYYRNNVSPWQGQMLKHNLETDEIEAVTQPLGLGLGFPLDHRAYTQRGELWTLLDPIAVGGAAQAGYLKHLP